MRKKTLCCVLLLFSSALCWIERAGAALELRSRDGVLFQGTSLSVGRASDVIVEVRCVVAGGGNVAGVWRSLGATLVEQGLVAFGTSQEDGLLRIFPLAATSFYECVSPENSTDVITVEFILEVSLFFTEDVPSVSLPEDLACSVPDIPAANVTVRTENQLSYCRVETERGTFRSRAVSPPPDPQFLFEPQNITVNSVNGTTRAAFSCAVVPTSRLISIRWEYTSQMFGSGADNLMPTTFSNGVLDPSVETGLTITTALDAGTSLLVIEPASDDEEGFYTCMAEFRGSVTLSSEPATLVSNSTALPNGVVILAPPPVVMVTAGDAVSVPCVTVPGNPTFSGPTGGSTTEGFNLLFPSISSANDGQYNCSSESGSSVDFTIQVSVPPAVTFTSTGMLTPQAAPNSGDAVLFSNCAASGTGMPMYSWLQNGEPVVSDGRIVLFGGERVLRIGPSIFTSDSGFYQCVAQIADQPSTLITTSSYVLVPDVSAVAVTPTTQNLVAGSTTTLTCTAEGNPLPSLTWTRNSQPVTEGAQQAATGFRETAMSTLTVQVGPQRVETFVCTATIVNPSLISIEASATVNVATPPVFIQQPQNDTVALEGVASFTCSAQSVPTPVISWVDGNGTSLDDERFSISTTPIGDINTSVLEFPANLGISMVVCEVTTTLGEIRLNLTSGPANIIIAGVPGAVNVSVDEIAARNASISWTTADSLLPVTYTVEYIQTNNMQSGSTVTADLEAVLAPLQPNRGYNITVTAMNDAGAGPGSFASLVTLEDAPDAAPTFVETSALELGQISVEWGPPPVEQQNGDIISYIVQYNSTVDETLETNVTTLNAVITITPGETYCVRVAAATAVGLGPFSEALLQSTIPVAPTFPPTVSPPITGAPTTPTSITITLPTLPAGDFSHVWVVVVRLDTSVDSTLVARSPTDVFPNINRTTAVYNMNIDPGVPYIAAEGLASSIPQPFILGDDNATRSFNDVPLYTNGPLLEGTSYTVFVRAFVPSVMDGQSPMKRQATPRQYSSFSSSRFISPVTTAVMIAPSGNAGLNAGAIVGIVIAVVLFVVVLVGMVIILYMLWDRFVFIKEHGGPPPSRKGSMRLRDPREVITTATTLRNYKAEAELQDLNPDDVRLPVALEDFVEYTRTMHANTDHLFSEEYEILSIKSPSLPHVQCSMPVNVAKNRYANINCYDESRVHLSLLPAIDGSDYINANYIDGYMKKNAYIATQGPLANTTQDFWRLVWEQESSCIIMLTNIVEKSRAKCHQYWPEVGSIALGDLTITLIEVQLLAYYTIRTFKLNRGNDRREIKQFHYTGWPDFGVPDHPNPVIAFIRRINNYHRPTSGPDIIHCSAGVGRTGTLITIQAMMEMMREEGKADVFNFVLAMRRQRNYMVQTERQYIFIHDAIVEKLHVGDTEIGIQNLRRRYKELLAQDPHTGSSAMEQEYKRLSEMSVADESQFHPARLSVNVPKNRFSDILPYDKYRVRLLLYPGVVGSDYINASYVDGYQHRHQYILTQGPLSFTVNDFWRMMWEHRVSSVLMLCQLEEKGKEQCVRYWPSEKIKAHGDLLVELSQVSEHASYTLREFSITNTKINESRMLKHYQFPDWMEDQSPANAAAIIDLIGVLQKTQHMCGGGPIVVHDSSSVGRAGTFSVLSSVLEQLKVEGIVDLFFAVHSLRQQQYGVVSTFEQYRFCYQAVMEFLDSFDHYANFD